MGVWVLRQKDDQQRQDQPSVTKYGNEHRAPFLSFVKISNYRSKSSQEFLISELIEFDDEGDSHCQRCDATNNKSDSRKYNFFSA